MKSKNTIRLIVFIIIIIIIIIGLHVSAPVACYDLLSALEGIYQKNFLLLVGNREF
jgi:hypothetical protein